MTRLLSEGANPNHRTKSKKFMMRIAASKNNVEIVKLLVRYGANITVRLIKCIFESVMDHADDIIPLIIAYNENRQKQLLQMMVCKLILHIDPEENPPASNVLKLLIDLGLPLDDYIEWTFYEEEPMVYEKKIELFSPLHLSIINAKKDFVSKFFYKCVLQVSLTNFYINLPLIRCDLFIFLTSNFFLVTKYHFYTA